MWGKSIICITPFLPIQILVILQISYGKPALKEPDPHLNSTGKDPPPPILLDVSELTELDINASSEVGSASSFSETLSISLTVLPGNDDVLDENENDTLAESSSTSFTAINDSINSNSSSSMEPDYYDDVNSTSSSASGGVEDDEAELVHLGSTTSIPIMEGDSTTSSDDLMMVAGSLGESVTALHSLSTDETSSNANVADGDGVEELALADESIIIASSVMVSDSSSNLNVDLVEPNHNHHHPHSVLPPPPPQIMEVVGIGMSAADEMQTEAIISSSSEPSASLPPSASPSEIV